jgi:lysophospholipase L1-like esterase
MGKTDIWEYTENVKKNQYNDLMIAKYKGKEPVVDIAAIESTKPDGSRNTYDYDGKTYYVMVPEYTYDGGHLNEDGRKRVAAAFLVTLVNEI